MILEFCCHTLLWMIEIFIQMDLYEFMSFQSTWFEMEVGYYIISYYDVYINVVMLNQCTCNVVILVLESYCHPFTKCTPLVDSQI